MTQAKDLTRWNRAGLSRFTYVDGNAADYLERLRAYLAEVFPAPEWDILHQVPAAGEENEQQRLQRVVEQYTALRRDWGWELARSLSRASHILCGHVDRYANESYLRTATQWDNLRKMVEMLDYHPAPPASAATSVALETKPDMGGTVAKGLQFKYAPPQGGEAAIFETLEDIDVDAQLNLIHLQGWNRCNDPFDPFACAGSPWQYQQAPEASVGDIALLMHDPRQYGNGEGITAWAVATRLKQIDETTLCIGPSPADAASQAFTWIKGATHLDYAAKDIFPAHLNGQGVVVFAQPHGLVAEQVITWPEAGGWEFNVVAQAEERRIRLVDTDRMPSVLVYSALRIQPVPSDDGSELEFRVPMDIVAAAYRNTDGELEALDARSDADGGDFVIAKQTVDGEEIPLYKRLMGSIDAVEIYIARPDMPQKTALTVVGAAPSVDEGIYTFDGSPGDLASGLTVVGEGLDAYGEAQLQALVIMSIREDKDSFELRLSAQGSANATGFAIREGVDLHRLLRRVEQSLDQEVFRKITLGELLSGSVGERSVVDIQGIGAPETSGDPYSVRLAAIGVETIAQLAALEVSAHSEFSPVRLREMKARAEILMDAKMSASGLEGLLSMGLSQVMDYGGGTALRAGTGTDAGLVFSRLLRIHGPFEERMTPVGYDRNTEPAASGDGWLSLALDAWPELLVRGRRLLLEQWQDERYSEPHYAELADIDGKRIRLQPPLPDKGYTLGNTIVRANVVLSGHGEAHSEKVLGSGDATLSSQVFTFKVEGISFIADATQSSGVRADIEVKVDGRTWRQVASLKDSKPFDHDYTVHMTEDGYLLITFGDGRYGRRLPSGNNNVRIAYRKGTGLGGKIPALAFTKPSKPHALIKAAHQPVASSGGNDMEDATSLRENAPATVLTLERAVSMADFSRLATAHSSIWQAIAVGRKGGFRRKQAIEVVAVPADGGPMGDELKKTLKDYLQDHSTPDVSISVVDYTEIPYAARINVKVDTTAYNIEEVIPAVQAAVSHHFSLRYSRLGASIYISEVYKVVEAVAGVEYSEVSFMVPDTTGQLNDSEFKVLKPGDFQTDKEPHQKVLVLSFVVVNPISPAQGDVAMVKSKRV